MGIVRRARCVGELSDRDTQTWATSSSTALEPPPTHGGIPLVPTLQQEHTESHRMKPSDTNRYRIRFAPLAALPHSRRQPQRHCDWMPLSV
jgi:hypothetical protein